VTNITEKAKPTLSRRVGLAKTSWPYPHAGARVQQHNGPARGAIMLDRIRAALAGVKRWVVCRVVAPSYFLDP